MAELEVIKHAKNVMNTAGDKEKGWKHKLKEIVLEILIIVFAVSLSISLHNWSEARHDRHEEHEFLVGLKKDLESDIQEMKSDSATHRRLLRGVAYFQKVSRGEALNRDSLNEYAFIFYNATYLAPNNSRFEGLRASGKLSIIRNKDLLNNMLDLYQEQIPSINLNNEWANNYKLDHVSPYMDDNIDLSADELSNWETVIRSRRLKNAFMRMENISEVVDQYGFALQKVRTLIRQIDKELH